MFINRLIISLLNNLNGTKKKTKDESMPFISQGDRAHHKKKRPEKTRKREII